MPRVVGLGLSFDDVLLIPKKSVLASRKLADTSTLFSKHLKLNIPIVSASMDTVTEAEMAITLARLGGIGVIHRFMSIERQVAEVLKVKRADNFVIDDPYTVNVNLKVSDARKLMLDLNVSGLVVVNESNVVQGIITKRDIEFVNDDTFVSAVMTPASKLVTANPSISLEDAKKVFSKHKVEKLVLVDDNNVLKGLITRKDLRKITEFPKAVRDEKGKLLVAAAIGVKDIDFQRAEQLIKAGVDALVIDVAHAHSQHVIKFADKLRSLPFIENSDVDLVIGNVATAEAVEDLSFADAIKVGIGPGSTCTTRIVTGHGVPQLTAIMQCSEVAKKYGIPVIADGGIKHSGDLVKALAAGADTCMIGGLFAGTKESPGIVVSRNGKKYKLFRGMASLTANFGSRSKDLVGLEIVPEGVEMLVALKGSAVDVVEELVAGLRSGLSYAGGRNIKELQANAEFVQITNAGLKESLPRQL
ncbi:IMP dehydrogenase [Candidatus Woesearchaeota archaeon]|nr:IMP dehydrogenase [Candidatus Woesearchaeota archaeon]